MAITQEKNIEMLEKLPDGHFKIKYPKTKKEQVVGIENIQNYGIATQAEAQAGTSNVKYMTPLRVKEAIEKLGNSKIAKGSYTGNGANNRLITVGFKPTFVIITPPNPNYGGGGYAGIMDGLFTYTFANTSGSGLGKNNIVDNGFLVGTITGKDGWGNLKTNASSEVYNWIAVG